MGYYNTIEAKQTTMTFDYKPLHKNYLLLCEMDLPTPIKSRMLDDIISMWPGHWRVLGATKAALEEFANNDYVKVSGMDINRSHLTDRIDRNTLLLETPITDAEEWWQFVIDHDGTYFATKSENLSDKWSEMVEFTELPDGAFRNAGFGWRHRKSVEMPYLKALHAQAV